MSASRLPPWFKPGMERLTRRTVAAVERWESVLDGPQQPQAPLSPGKSLAVIRVEFILRDNEALRRLWLHLAARLRVCGTGPQGCSAGRRHRSCETGANRPAKYNLIKKFCGSDPAGARTVL